jgi:hypothetical protein
MTPLRYLLAFGAGVATCLVGLAAWLGVKYRTGTRR